jgi:hypothetical protein
MASPFPGMNPYLEHPEIWPGVHHWLIIAIAEFLTPQLRPKYSVSVEVRMYETSGEQSLLVGLPDVSIQRLLRQSTSEPLKVATTEPSSQPIPVIVPIPESIRLGYLEIREVKTKDVVTAIKLLSPVNKRPGKGRQTYENKREQVLGSLTHLVEIDLLRFGEPMPLFIDRNSTDYRILVSRKDCRPRADLYAFNLPDIIPSFPLPLRSNDPEPTLDLLTLLNQVYDRGGYDLKLDYTLDPIPPLSETNQVWVDAILKQNHLR